MGLFKSIKKAFKKVTGFVKKTIKKTVGAVKKVAKKISKSKILKALAIAAAIVVTGGAALTAFGGTGALASSQLGTWMMSTSQAVLGGTAFGSAAAMKPGVGKFLTQTGNFLAKTAAKPFGAVGGALGSTARVGANILTPNTTLFQAGPAGAGTAAAAPAPFSSAALRGQTVNQVPVAPGVKPPEVKETFGTKVKNFAGDVATGVVTSVATGYAMEEILGDDPTGGYGAGLKVEGASNKDPLQIYAAGKGIDVGSIYNNMTYGTADPSFAAGTALYNQSTVGVPA